MNIRGVSEKSEMRGFEFLHGLKCVVFIWDGMPFSPMNTVFSQNGI